MNIVREYSERVKARRCNILMVFYWICITFLNFMSELLSSPILRAWNPSGSQLASGSDLTISWHILAKQRLLGCAIWKYTPPLSPYGYLAMHFAFLSKLFFNNLQHKKNLSFYYVAFYHHINHINSPYRKLVCSFG